MNYLRIYKNLIKHRKQNVLHKEKEYCETHHIIPRSLNGKNQHSNLVNLTAREHFVAHLLLSKIFEKRHLKFNTKNSKKKFCKMLFAIMLFKQNKHLFSSRNYEKAKLKISKEKTRFTKKQVLSIQKFIKENNISKNNFDLLKKEFKFNGNYEALWLHFKKYNIEFKLCHKNHSGQNSFKNKVLIETDNFLKSNKINDFYFYSISYEIIIPQTEIEKQLSTINNFFRKLMQRKIITQYFVGGGRKFSIKHKEKELLSLTIQFFFCSNKKSKKISNLKANVFEKINNEIKTELIEELSFNSRNKKQNITFCKDEIIFQKTYLKFKKELFSFFHKEKPPFHFSQNRMISFFGNIKNILSNLKISGKNGVGAIFDKIDNLKS